jgi:hypothetical protein
MADQMSQAALTSILQARTMRSGSYTNNVRQKRRMTTAEEDKKSITIVASTTMTAAVAATTTRTTIGITRIVNAHDLPSTGRPRMLSKNRTKS